MVLGIRKEAEKKTKKELKFGSIEKVQILDRTIPGK